MKLVQMDRLHFFDNFSYINYFIWSYGRISMIFISLSQFLEFLVILNARKALLCQQGQRDRELIEGVIIVGVPYVSG